MIWLWFAIGAYVLLLLGICLISARPPRVPVFFAPGTLGLPQQDVELQSADGIQLHGWWIEAPDSEVVAVLVHGYLMNRSELCPLAVWLRLRGISSLAFDLRAQGKSAGQWCTFGRDEAQDVLAGVRFARERCPSAKIVVIGSSMGAAAAALALHDDPKYADAMVLDCCYSRLWVACLGWWHFLGGRVLQSLLAPTVVLGPLVTRVNPFSVDVARALSNSRAPVLLIHGTCDRIAPPSEANRNLDACGSRGRLVWMEGCDHAEGRWTQPEKYLETLNEFLTENGFLSKQSPVEQLPASVV